MTAYFRRIRRTVIVEEYEGDKVKVFVLDTGYTGDRIQIVERWELSHWKGNKRGT